MEIYMDIRTYLRQPLKDKEFITDDGICDIIEKCNIKSLTLKCYTKITIKSLNAFIERAKHNSKIQYKFNADIYEESVYEQMNNIRINNLYCNIDLKLIQDIN
jgi:hypothetical protein